MVSGETTMRFRLGTQGLCDRRAFLAAGSLSLFGVQLAAGLQPASPRVPPRRRTARSTILIWLSGGASHIDTWDMKPHAPAEYRGQFRPMQTSAPGILLCEYL